MSSPVMIFALDEMFTYLCILLLNSPSSEIVRAINSFNKKSKVTVYPKSGHDAWTHTYKMTGQGFERPEYDPFDMNVYEWLLQFSK